jgi:hypothetical protein
MGERELIERFYRAFSVFDGKAMARAYAPGAHFWDPVFLDLHGERIGAMWQMLCERGGDLKIDLVDARSSGEGKGEAHWEARYPFSLTGRRVHNVIHARFEIKEGLIVDHRDEFDLWRWTRMALPFVQGTLLGWSPIVQGAIRKKAKAQLERYVASKR